MPNGKKLPRVDVDASYGKLTNIPVFKNGILEDPEYIPIKDHSTYGAGIEAYFNLYNGNKNNLQLKQEESKQVLQQYLMEETASNVFYKVAENYLDVQRCLALKMLIEQNIRRNKKRLDQITKLYSNGVVLKSDLLRAQLQLSKEQVNLLKMSNNVELSTQQLNILIGYDDEDIINPTDSLGLDCIKGDLLYRDYLDQAMRSSPHEKIAQTQIVMSQLKEKEQRADKLPQIGMFGEYTYSYPQNKLYPYATSPYLLGVAGVKVSYNISALYRDVHKEKAASIMIEKQKLIKEKMEDNLRNSIQIAFKRFHESLEEIDVAKMNIKQAEENYRIVNETYFNQLALLTDLLSADTQLIQAKCDLVNSQISARLYYYQLLKISGQL
ncbi:TolC family protein [Plebeiibacterium marinum]|uniref:TolC family protein n=1 Tax=Plebeiibacterium marinum TaxID=2992111 RepID=A0AAE3MBH0_9BACT|nr:TolC family protein [Plebeiobacterium marinum]MCW3804494.1 TolC family protein [Plebeiobacterium marinum]